jgi:predicted  nucleic acid-binding Zn-ribbon protein
VSQKLEAIERLQNLDLEIDANAQALAGLPGRRAELEADVVKARNAADQERGRLADQERARRTVAQGLEQRREDLKKWEARLSLLKHEREFAARQREIEHAKKENLLAEEELKKLDAAAAEIKARLRTFEAELAAREAALASGAATLDADKAALEGKAAAYAAQREELRARADEALVKSYEAVRRKVKGKALVPLAMGNCAGCRRKLPAQLVNLLHAGAVLPCPGCARLVFIPPPAIDTQA